MVASVYLLRQFSWAEWKHCTALVWPLPPLAHWTAVLYIVWNAHILSRHPYLQTMLFTCRQYSVYFHKCWGALGQIVICYHTYLSNHEYPPHTTPHPVCCMCSGDVCIITVLLCCCLLASFRVQMAIQQLVAGQCIDLLADLPQLVAAGQSIDATSGPTLASSGWTIYRCYQRTYPSQQRLDNLQIYQQTYSIIEKICILCKQHCEEHGQ